MKNEEKLDIMQKLYPVGAIIEGEVIIHATFGILLNIGHGSILGLIEVPQIREKGEPGLFNYSTMYPPLKSKVKARVLGHRPENNQVYLSMRPSVLKDGWVGFTE